MIHFWTYVVWHGLGYHQDDGSFAVGGGTETETQRSEPVNGTSDSIEAAAEPTTVAPTEAPPCRQSVTRIDGNEAPPCSGQLLFADDFDDLNASRWRIEQRFGASPDYEFGAYLSRPDTVRVHDGQLSLDVVRLDDDISGLAIELGAK